MAVTAQADEVHRVISAAVDPAFYRAVYPDVAESGVEPLRHYLLEGWREKRDPAPWFSTADYLAANADVRRMGMEPLYHFLTIGRREGREVFPSRHAEAYLAACDWSPAPWGFEAFLRTPLQRAEPEPQPAAIAEAQPLPPPAAAGDDELVAAEFDRAWYLAAYPDIADAGVDPLRHFMMTGWREGRDPNARFSVKDYLETYPDIGLSGMNPFVHYLRAGRAEGRIPRHELGFRYEVLARSTPPQARLEQAIAATAAVETGDARALVQALKAAPAGLKDVHLTFSHDDYTATFGGVQLCLQREAAGLAARGIDHLHLYPAKPWPTLRAAGEPGAIGVLLNGRRLGAFAPAALREALGEAAGAKGGRRSFAIHNLLGHDVDETVELVAALGLSAGFFWLHDFASLCAGFHLLRNDVEDCAAPPPDSIACGICAYGPLRARHLDAHRRLFERLALTVVAPSQTTLDFWRASWSYPAKDAVVLPHVTLTDRGPAPGARRKGPFRLAFVGMPVALKGWPVFRELAARHADDPRYAFFHLGGRSDPSVKADFRRVEVSAGNPHAMREALEASEADAALIWPLCRETFSFTAYEAAAAGCAVITGPDSGNVAAFVTDTGLGRVLPTEAALAEAFETGAILDLARGRRKARVFDLAFSRMSVDLLPQAPGR